MSAVRKTLSPQPRGTDRRAEPRDGQLDWRVNPRSYEFVGAHFDPLTPMQTLTRCKWITTDHGFRYIVTPNVDHIVRLTKEPEVFKRLEWLFRLASEPGRLWKRYLIEGPKVFAIWLKWSLRKKG